MNIIVVVNCFIKMRYIVPIDLINAISVAKCFKKLHPIFLDIEFNRNKSEINELIKYKYKNNP